MWIIFSAGRTIAGCSEALQKLPALKRVTNMLICGEDLGMVPACVPEVMKRLGLLSLEIQRMPKALGMDFSRPADAPYLSVVTPGTHDMSTIRGWWREDSKLTQKFFNQELRQSGPAPLHCEPWVNREIVRQHLDSPAMWSIFQLQDLLGMDESLRRPTWTRNGSMCRPIRRITGVTACICRWKICSRLTLSTTISKKLSCKIRDEMMSGLIYVKSTTGKIPKGFDHSAQGCAATWVKRKNEPKPRWSRNVF